MSRELLFRDTEDVRRGCAARAAVVALALASFGLVTAPLAPGAYGAGTLIAQEVPASGQPRMTATWRATPIDDVLLAFATFSGRSIVPGAGVTGSVTAEIVDQPWDVALQAILIGHGLVASEDSHGIIRVQDMATIHDLEGIEPIVTRVYRLSFVQADEIRAALEPLLSARGSISVSPSTNSVIVSDVARVHAAVGGLLRD